MRETLYILLPDSADPPRLPFARVAGTPGASVAVEHAPLPEILEAAAGRRIVLFVPARDVRLTSVTVPARQAQKILQAAPYVLEDQLAEDVDTLHFAIGPDAHRRRPDEPHPVAIVARERMEAWLAPLRAVGLRADAVIPETLGLPPPEDDRWVGLVDAGRATVRSSAFGGFSCALDDLPAYLQIADPEARASLRLFVTRNVEYDFSRAGRPAELLPGNPGVLEVLVRHWRPETSINLLQGTYSEKEDWRRLAQPWRLAAGLAAAWIGAALVAEAAQALRTGHALRELEAANVARYQSLFPAETRIVDLGAQARQQLEALRSGSARAPLFALLDTVAGALAATPGLTLQALQFREGALYLSLTGSDLATLEALRAWYGARRDALLHVEAANAGSEGVQIRVKVTPA